MKNYARSYHHATKKYLLLSVIAAASCAGMSAQAATRENNYGSAAPPTAAGRLISITASTKWVNVDNGETVTFVNGGHIFTWNFRTLRESDDLPLSAIAPADFGAGKVEVYVAWDPLYR